MNEPTLLDIFNVSLDEVLSLRSKADQVVSSHKGECAKLTLLQRSPSTALRIGEKFVQMLNIQSRAGMINAIGLSKEHGDKQQFHTYWNEALDRLMPDPVFIRNRTVWILFYAILDAQFDFSLDVCPAPSHESVLTGQLLGAIKGACKDWKSASKTLLDRLSGSLKMGSIDLSILGGEQKTGGDFALILDIQEHAFIPADVSEDTVRWTKEPRGNFALPLIFQAKRYDGDEADISQFNANRGYQYNLLRKNECASAYIFYENGTEAIETPVVPLVKLVNDVASVGRPTKTNVFEHSLDLATYILGGIDGCLKLPIAHDEADAINMILANASTSRLSEIVLLANNGTAQSRYAAALKKLKNEIDNPPPSPSSYARG